MKRIISKLLIMSMIFSIIITPAHAATTESTNSPLSAGMECFVINKATGEKINAEIVNITNSVIEPRTIGGPKTETYTLEIKLPITSNENQRGNGGGSLTHDNLVRTTLSFTFVEDVFSEFYGCYITYASITNESLSNNILTRGGQLIVASQEAYMSEPQQAIKRNYSGNFYEIETRYDQFCYENNVPVVGVVNYTTVYETTTYTDWEVCIVNNKLGSVIDSIGR